MKLSSRAKSNGLRACFNSLVVAAAAAIFFAPNAETQGVPSQSGELRVFATRSIATVLEKIGSEFERRTGRKLNVTTDVAARMVRRINAGEAFDFLVAAPAQIDELIKAGKIIPETRADLARSGIGIAVRVGAPKPDVSSVGAFKRAVLSARSIAYLKEGQSGVYVAGVLERLGIADAVRSKLTLPETDIVSELVSRGEIELGIVVITQILTTPGVALAGPLPSEIQSYITFTGGISAKSKSIDAAKELMTVLKSPAAIDVMRSQGMEPGEAQSSARLMAITIDDLPYLHVGPPGSYIQNAERGTREILRVLREHRAHAVGFVNEGKLWAPAQRDERIALLRQWVDGGMTLGNHTYSHPDLNQRTVAQFQREIVDGEKVTRQLMATREPYQRFFRHPMTHTGDTKEKKEAIDRFLTSRGYKIAPHTIENSDFLFDVPYAEGRRHDDAAFMKKVRDLYLDYTMATTAFAEQLSVQIFGREIPQTLLIHANDITADTLDEMLTRFEARGYRFISLDEAMAHPAYQTPDTHVSTYGPTWLVRWARSLNKAVSYKDEPEMPALPVRR